MGCVFFFFGKGMWNHFRNGRQLTSLQFAWPFYESDPTNQAGVPLRPCRWVICMGKSPPRRTYVHFGGLFSEGLVSWKDGKWSPYVLSPLDALSPRNYEAESPDEFALVKAAANAGWEFKSRCLDESTVVFFLGVFFVCFLNAFWLVVGGTLQKLDAKVPTSPGTKKKSNVWIPGLEIPPKLLFAPLRLAKIHRNCPDTSGLK